ncbi:MAG: endonuclease MutS2 [Gemmatimonas sp.]|nr:endonuclease MutS2 [Gemmatimonas sp.]
MGLKAVENRLHAVPPGAIPWPTQHWVWRRTSTVARCTLSAGLLFQKCSRMISHASDVLEFDEGLAVVAALASSPVGAEAVRRLVPCLETDRVHAEIALVAEGIALLGSEDGWAMPAIPDLEDALSRLKLEGYVWDGPTLRDGARLLGSARTARRTLRAPSEISPGLAAIAEILCELTSPQEAIERAIDEDGAVRDAASPELRRLRRELHTVRGRIVGRLTEFAASLPPHFQVSDASVSLREGRYVIPVRREGRGEVGGIVHGESQTGATLFIEPPIAIEMMNRLRELEAAEAREVQRILRELTEVLRPHADELAASLETLIRLDTVHARARYASLVDGHPPEVCDPRDDSLVVVQGRHPLLLAKGEAVVPFDLRMEKGERTVVISGPNTGGKTVLLKAIGLLTLMVRSGIVPPVGPGTRLPLFAPVFADIGDEQSIEASLSTFSAHLKNLRETLTAADTGSLVLIDEIGSGTDPVEGGALAQAILLELTSRSAFTVATTHLGNLKLLAVENESIVNASLQFDAERLEPTFRLLKGTPGRSYGLAIARRLGLPRQVLEGAEQALPRSERDVGKLLLELEANEQRLAKLNADLEAQVAKTTALESELEHRSRELSRREKDAERRARQQARDLLMQSRSEVEAAIEEVRGAADEVALEEAARAARRRVEEAARKQRERIPEERSRVPQSRGDLEVGARVRIESLGRTGRLLELRDARAVVDAGDLRLQLPADDLTMLPPGDQDLDRAAVRHRPAGGRIEADLDASAEIDLRGLRVDELGLRLGRGLDNALMAGLPSFRIIHGKGTGALRAEVQEILRGDPRIASFRPGGRLEGDTGVTIVEFA